jgi:hypothetical protein
MIFHGRIRNGTFFLSGKSINGLPASSAMTRFCPKIGTASYRRGQRITLRQAKTGKALPSIPVLPELKRMLDAAPRTAVQVVVSEETDRPYTTDNFQHLFASLRAKAELPNDLWFADLRRTVATTLGRAGCTEDEIRAITGHHTREVLQINVRPDPRFAEAAINKLKVERTKQG